MMDKNIEIQGLKAEVKDLKQANKTANKTMKMLDNENNQLTKELKETAKYLNMYNKNFNKKHSIKKLRDEEKEYPFIELSKKKRKYLVKSLNKFVNSKNISTANKQIIYLLCGKLSNDNLSKIKIGSKDTKIINKSIKYYIEHPNIKLFGHILIYYELYAIFDRRKAIVSNKEK